MQNLEKLINHSLTEKFIKTILIIIAIPFVMYTLNLCLSTLYNLGQASGTFLRNLYNIVC